MMFSNKLVVAIKHKNKVLREHGDLVKLPFGSEFTVLVKNLNSRRAKFTLHIDGTDVLDGTEIIVNANSEVEIKRYIRLGNMDEGNAFKFIERTKSIENGPRGIKMDDGIVRVEFWFEKEKPEVKTTIHNDIWWDNYYHRYPVYGRPYFGDYTSTSGIVGSSTSDSSPKMKGMGGGTRGSSLGSGVEGQSMNAVFGSNTAFQNATISANVAQASNTISDAGITVPGSKVEQKFITVHGFDTEVQSHVIVLRLAGKTGEVEVVKPITVKTKNKCVTCGHVNKHSAKFCTDCGTALELL